MVLVLKPKESDFKAIQPALYVAKIEKIEAREEKKWQSEELETKINITFAIVKAALGNGLLDVTGEAFNPLGRFLWKSFYPTLRTKKKGMPVTNTKLGDVMACVGLDTTDPALDLEKALGKFVILNVEVKPKPTEPNVMKNVISSISAFTGDINEINSIIDQVEKDANVAKEIYDAPYEETAPKKKA